MKSVPCRTSGTMPDTPGWRVRVVPNKYPALDSTATENVAPTDLYEHLPGWGVHEVIIESSRHVTSTWELTDDELAEVFGVYRDRLVAIKRDPRLRYGMIFKNVGPAQVRLWNTHTVN